MSDQKLQGIVRALSDARGKNLLGNIVLALCNAINASYTFVAELDAKKAEAKTLVLASNGRILDNFSYELNGTPCHQVVGNNPCIYPCNIQSLYPNDQLLIDMGIEGYVGTPLHSDTGEVTGIVVALFKEPLVDPNDVKTLFLLFSGIIAGEMEKRKQAHQLERSKRMLDCLGEGVFCVDTTGKTTFANEAASHILGYAPDELLDSNSHCLFHNSYPDGRHYPSEECPVFLTLQDGKHRQAEDAFIHKNGETVPVEITANPIIENGKIDSVVVVFSDISERKKSEQEIIQLAFYDPLTQLPNRRLLSERIERALAESYRSMQYGAIMMIDLDHFKIINDTEGHDAGDLVLQATAKNIVKTLRGTDTVGRLGGDEFLVLLANLGQSAFAAQKHAARVAYEILKNLNVAHEISARQYFTTSSIGITLFKGHNDDAGQLLKEADIAMYEAKNKGRNRYEFFNSKPSPSKSSAINGSESWHQG